jgi:hypothetical protein
MDLMMFNSTAEHVTLPLITYTVEEKYSAVLFAMVPVSPGDTARHIGIEGFMKESWINGGLPNAMLRVLGPLALLNVLE